MVFIILFSSAFAETFGTLTALDNAQQRIQIDGHWYKLSSTVRVSKENVEHQQQLVLPSRLKVGMPVTFSVRDVTVTHLNIVSGNVDRRPDIALPILEKRP